MSSSAIILILISAFMHAGWNLLGKHSSPNLAFFFLANLGGSLILLLPVTVYYADLLTYIDARTLWYGCVSGLFLAAYYWGLARAYQVGDLSIIYPLARSFPVILVALFTILSGYSGLLNAFFIGGGLLIVCGSIILPMRHFTDLQLSHYLNPASWYAMIAALGTTGYSIIDGKATAGLQWLIDTPQQIIALTLIYAFIQVIFASAWMGLALMFNQQTRDNLVEIWRRKPAASLLTGIAIHATYAIILISMSMAENVSYVVAFRQISIPIGVMLGIYIFKEPKSLPRIIGIVAMFSGATLVSLG